MTKRLVAPHFAMQLHFYAAVIVVEDMNVPVEIIPHLQLEGIE